MPDCCRAVGLAIVAWALVVVNDWGMTWSERPTTHEPHVVASADAHEFAAVIEHPHLEADSVLSAPDSFIAAVLPRATTVLVALGVLAATVSAFTLWASSTRVFARGPPQPVTAGVAGRILLIRLCIARR